MKRSTAREDLFWLFSQCESEMGLKSNFNSLILASKGGGKRTRLDDAGDLVNGVQEDLFNEDALIDAIDTSRAVSRLAATGRNRRVMAAYQRLHVMHQRVLEAHFEARQFPPEVREAFGELAALAACTATARALSASCSWPWMAKAILQKDPRIAQMKREAQALLDQAVAAYERARDGEEAA